MNEAYGMHALVGYQRLMMLFITFDGVDNMIQIQNMSFRYPGGRNLVFDDISLDIQEGHIIGLLGKNGVGKSTLFRLITGVNKQTHGTILTQNMVPFDRSPEMLRQLFLLPEDIEFPKLPIRKYAEYFGAFYPNYNPEVLQKYIELFDIPEQPLSTMSLGQRKKAMLAFAFALNTEILLMDEPTNGLDIPSKRLFRTSLSEFNATNKTIIISTHQVRDLEELIDAVIIVDEQKIVLTASFATLLGRYHFGELAPEDDVLYEEKMGGRRCGVARLKTGQEKDASVDMELLFNAAVSGAFAGEVLS